MACAECALGEKSLPTWRSPSRCGSGIRSRLWRCFRRSSKGEVSPPAHAAIRSLMPMSGGLDGAHLRSPADTRVDLTTPHSLRGGAVDNPGVTRTEHRLM